MKFHSYKDTDETKMWSSADLRAVPVSRDALAKYCAGSSSSW